MLTRPSVCTDIKGVSFEKVKQKRSASGKEKCQEADKSYREHAQAYETPITVF